MDRVDQIADDPPSTEEAKKRIAALGLGGPRTCGRCGQIRKGRIVVGFTDYFVCFNCLVKDEAKALSETEEFIRKDKVWRIRKARQIWKSKNLVKNRYEDAEMLKRNYLTESEKEELARKLMNTIDLPVTSP